MIEEWKEIAGGYISNLGNVKSKYGRLLSKRILKTGQGYYQVDIAKKTHLIHRLVCIAFNGPAPEGMNIVRHLDGNTFNNVPSNLAWGTQKDNCQDTVKHGRSHKGTRHPMNKLTEDEVRSIRKALAEGAKGIDLAEQFGVSFQLISRIKTNKSWNWLI